MKVLWVLRNDDGLCGPFVASTRRLEVVNGNTDHFPRV